MKRFFFVSLLGALVSGCANTAIDKDLLVSGTKNVRYDSDLTNCKKTATAYKSDEIGGLTAIRTLEGALLGATVASDGERGDAAMIGAVFGAVLGANESYVQQNRARREILIKCMQNRGHDVLA